MDEQMHETIATYDQVAEMYREKHADRGVVKDQLASFLAALDGETVLDVGCGPGWESAVLAERGLTVIGIDLSESFLTMATEEAPGAHFSRMDMRNLALSSCSVDGIWACASVHHVPRTDIEAVLAEFRRVLSPSGVVSVTCKRGENETTGKTFGSADTRQFVRYEPDELAKLVMKTGFNVRSLEATAEWNEMLMKVTR